MPMDWEEWQKSRQKNRQSVPGSSGQFNFGNFFNKFKAGAANKGNSKMPLWLVAALAIGWLSSGFFQVEPNELGLISRFGQYNRMVDPGLSYHLPYPIETVVKPNVMQARRVEIGSGNHEDEALMLTGDENIVDIKFIVQYRVKPNEAFNYVYKVSEPEKALRDAATSAMREVIGNNKIDAALTDGRQQIQADTKVAIQAMMDKYEAGIIVENVELQAVHPPKDVVESFTAVTSAKENKISYINQAMGHANDILPKAKGRAEAIIAQANGYRQEKVNLALGETSRFKAILTEYKKAPEITRQRLVLEAMDSVLPSAQKYIISGEAGQSILPHMNIKNETRPAQTQAPAVE